MGNIDNSSPKMKVTRIEKAIMIERMTKTEFPTATYQTLTNMVEAKQKEVLLRYFYLPFWISLDGILIFLAVLLALFGAWYLFSGFVFFAGFSTYIVRRSTRQLKKIREELSTFVSPQPLEQPAEVTLEEK